MAGKYVTDSYITSVGRIFWGYFFIYCNLNLGPVDVFPGWVGYIFLLTALPGIAELEPSAELLKPFTYILMAWDVFQMLAGFISGNDALQQLYGLGAVMAVVGLYFHFQLLTNLAQIAERQRSTHDRTFIWLRNGQTMLQTGIYLALLIGNKVMVFAGIHVLAGIAAAVAVILMIVLMVNLHGYKKELIQMNETQINRPWQQEEV